MHLVDEVEHLSVLYQHYIPHSISHNTLLPSCLRVVGIGDNNGRDDENGPESDDNTDETVHYGEADTAIDKPRSAYVCQSINNFHEAVLGCIML